MNDLKYLEYGKTGAYGSNSPLELGQKHSKRELERGLIARVEHFLRAMGGLFAFKCAPPWLGSEEGKAEEVVLRFPLAMNDPGALARVAREFLKQFPLREFPE